MKEVAELASFEEIHGCERCIYYIPVDIHVEGRDCCYPGWDDHRDDDYNRPCDYDERGRLKPDGWDKEEL